VLEETLIDFPGTVILVTHDRMMLDTVSHQLLALDGRGGTQFFSDYEQFEKVADQFLAEPDKKPAPAQKTQIKGKPKTGLSTAEKRELASMPETIEELEKQISSLQTEMEKPHVASNYAKLQEMLKQQDELKKRLELMFHRWEELEALQSA